MKDTPSPRHPRFFIRQKKKAPSVSCFSSQHPFGRAFRLIHETHTSCIHQLQSITTFVEKHSNGCVKKFFERQEHADIIKKDNLLKKGKERMIKKRRETVYEVYGIASTLFFVVDVVPIMTEGIRHFSFPALWYV